MKTLLTLLILSSVSFAGLPWMLQTCKYTHQGYEYGYVGVYEQNGDYIKIWFGTTYCPSFYYLN